MGELWTAVIGILSMGITAWAGWFFGRRKTNADAKSIEIDNDIKLSNQYKEVLDDLKIRYEEKYQELETRYNTRYNEYDSIMQRKVSMLEEEIKLKDRKIKLQQQEIAEVKRENKILKNAKANST